METDIHEITDTLSQKEKELFLKAFEFAKKAHSGQLRKSGESFIIHPIAVAKKLWKKYGDIDLAIAGLLHDTVEDNEDCHIEEVYRQFGDTVGFLVDAVDKREKVFYKKDIVFDDKIERLLWAGMQDIRVLLLKIADREHNIETLKHLQNDKQVRMAFETQAVYKPLKTALDLQNNNTIDKIKDVFDTCLENKKVSTPKEIKSCLYNMSFRDFSDEMFNLVYNNSNKVVWEIEDKTYLEELSQNEKFEKHVNIEEIWTNGTQFKASFTFDKGFILDRDVELKVSSYKSR